MVVFKREFPEVVLGELASNDKMGRGNADFYTFTAACDGEL